MTVLVGVLCQDGVVIGSDSSATLTAGQFRTIEQPTKKTFLVEPDVIVAGTGAAGLSQRFHIVVRQLRARPEWGPAEPPAASLTISPSFSSMGSPTMDLWDPTTVAKMISRCMIEEMAATHLRPGQLGALAAFPCGGSFHLYEFGVDDFQPECKVPGNWFVTMGSGQAIADPFFGLLRRTFFRNQQPRLQEGVFAAAWALEHAIELNTGGINGPPQIGILSRQDGQSPFTARLLTEDQLAEHKNNVDAAERYLAAYREQLNAPTPPTEPPPEPPPDANGLTGSHTVTPPGTG